MDSSNDPPAAQPFVPLAPQIAAGLALIAIGGFTVTKSIELGVGTLSSPGAGFAGLLAGVGLGALSIVVLAGVVLSARRQKRATGSEPGPSGALLNQVLVLVSMGVYIFLIPRSGYLVATFLFASAVVFLSLWRSWTFLLVGAAISLGGYLLFAVLLDVPLPL